MDSGNESKTSYVFRITILLIESLEMRKQDPIMIDKGMDNHNQYCKFDDRANKRYTE